MGAGRRGLGVEYRPEWAAKNLGRRREGYGGGGGGLHREWQVCREWGSHKKKEIVKPGTTFLKRLLTR